MERYLKFRKEYPRFFYRGYSTEETLNELKITYTFEIEGLSENPIPRKLWRKKKD